MKNFLKILIAVILGMFLIAGSSYAVPLDPCITDYITGNGTYVGGVVGESGTQLVYIGKKNIDPTSTPTLDDLKTPHQDSYTNVNLILTAYNNKYDPDLDPITTCLKIELEDGDLLNDVKAGTIVLSPGTEYISLKWDSNQGGWFLWNVQGLESFDFSGLDYGLSHYTEWNGEGGTPVPEPATLLLLGVGMVGLAGFGRKKIKK